MKSSNFLNIVFTVLLYVCVLTGCSKSKAASGYKLTDIRVSSASLELKVGESEQLKASAVPAAASQPYFQWASANSSIVTVSNGLVKAVAAGETTITVSASGISTAIPVRVSNVVYSYSDTVIRMTLKGAGYTFADHADYGVYIPTRTEPLRGVLVIQHGCGMEQFGITKPYDLQYRAFARKWKLAVIETALYGSCFDWRNPEAGTATALLKVLTDAATGSGHPELNTVPWLLWGHSGGGYWVLGMLKNYPERIMAAVCYSPAFDPQWTYPAAAAKVPLLTRHAGANDANDEIVRCQATSINTFGKLRNMDAPVSIALNAAQNHNYSYIRYMAIPFYEAVMKQRMNDNGGSTMKDFDRSQAWLGDTLTLQLYKEAGYSGNKKGLCLFPDEATAKNWKEYVSTGTVADKTPPPQPFNLSVRKINDAVDVSWEADADIESGILRFEIYVNDVLVGKLPETGAYQNFDTNGDNTFPVEVAPMKFRIAGAANSNATISVRTVNHFNLVSEKTNATYTK